MRKVSTERPQPTYRVIQAPQTRRSQLFLMDGTIRHMDGIEQELHVFGRVNHFAIEPTSNWLIDNAARPPERVKGGRIDRAKPVRLMASWRNDHAAVGEGADLGTVDYDVNVGRRENLHRAGDAVIVVQQLRCGPSLECWRRSSLLDWPPGTLAECAFAAPLGSKRERRADFAVRFSLRSCGRARTARPAPWQRRGSLRHHRHVASVRRGARNARPGGGRRRPARWRARRGDSVVSPQLERELRDDAQTLRGISDTHGETDQKLAAPREPPDVRRGN